MDPQVLGAGQWAEISHLLVYLFLFSGLGLCAALAFLLGHAILPSLVASRDAPPAVGALRWVAYPIAGLALLLGAYALARALGLAGQVVQQVYPRVWI
jgi:hypothetical protein